MQGIIAQPAGQQFSFQEEYPLTYYDSIMLARLPEFDALPVIKSANLPFSVNNSVYPYFREIYQQVSGECGQVSGIGYNFTYEMDRFRNLSASEPENQYPPHFTFNFMNGGYGWHGVSYFHSFEILRKLGCPTVATYGGMAAGGVSRWMNGYDNYYLAMKNRIREVYQIKVGTPEGLMTLKHWLHNHHDGSAIGGVASFYANAPWNLRTLPEGTPDAGKHIIVKWEGLPTHAMTIVGYNDSIRYDYNSDGLYTNHLDINEDGIVDMKDWEIGGLLFADGWGWGINFADSGLCYILYKTLADKVYEGGIWNNAVHVLDVKDLETPLLTAKVTLKHDKRGMLRVQCGVSSNQDDDLPEYTIGFPVFNFQGGSQYMQGGISPEANKTIEFGLDITPLLSYINQDEITKFFLIVEERDSSSIGSGRIMKFSVIDYSEEPFEIQCGNTAIPIINNGLTYASLAYSPDFNSVKINTSGLPPAVVGEPYAHQMECEGGTAPFHWHLLKYCDEEVFQQEIGTLGTFMEPANWNYGNILYPLAFSFPFYDRMYDTIYIHPNGFIMFRDTEYPWPYLKDSPLLIKNTACIAPFICKAFDIVPAFGHGIWVHEETGQFSIRWKAEIISNSYSPVVEFSLQLKADGEIIFTYGSEIQAHRIRWSCGISEGNDMNYHLPQIGEQSLIIPGDAVKLRTISLPSGLSLSEDGLLSGTLQDYYQRVDLGFCVEDDDLIRAYKTLEFSSTDLGIDNQEPEEENILAAIFPNPFHSNLTIMVNPGLDGPLTCEIYSASGSLVRVLSDRITNSQSLSWDGRNASGMPCPQGIYFLHCHSAGKNQIKKVIYTGQ